MDEIWDVIESVSEGFPSYFSFAHIQTYCRRASVMMLRFLLFQFIFFHSTCSNMHSCLI